MLFSGRSHPELAAGSASSSASSSARSTLKTFANGETYCRYEESIRGADLFIVQTGCAPVDKHLMELFIMIQAAKLASAKRITAVIPLVPVLAPGQEVGAARADHARKLVADVLQLAGADRVLTMDLHAGQIQGFFTIPVDHMTALPLFAQYFRDRGLTGEGVVSVSPDAGRAKMAVKFGEMIEAGFAIMHKTRPEHDQAAVTEVTGRVRGKIALIGDDIIVDRRHADRRRARAQGGRRGRSTSSRRTGCSPATRWSASRRRTSSTGSSSPTPCRSTRSTRPEKLTVLTVSGLLAETIWNVFADESVSAIFAGENQLF